MAELCSFWSLRRMFSCYFSYEKLPKSLGLWSIPPSQKLSLQPLFLLSHLLSLTLILPFPYYMDSCDDSRPAWVIKDFLLMLTSLNTFVTSFLPYKAMHVHVQGMGCRHLWGTIIQPSTLNLLNILKCSVAKLCLMRIGLLTQKM